MNISFLPRTIREQLKVSFSSLDDENLNADVIRSTTDSRGENGESYLILIADELYIYTRSIGDFDFDEIKIKIPASLKIFSAEQDNYKITVKIQTENEEMILKFSSFDIEDIEKIKQKIYSYMQGAGTSEQETAFSENVCESPFKSKLEILAAALMYLSTVDKDIDVSEDRYITAVFKDKGDILQRALKYFKTHTFEQFLNDCGRLSDEESLCILTHLVELGFSDTSLHISEQHMIKQFCDRFRIPHETFDAVTQVIFAKNNLSVLY